MSKNKRFVRLPKEAYEQLEESIEFLIIDAKGYDNGNFKMIKRSSTILRSLFHETQMSHSLIGQIDNRKSVTMKSLIKYPVDELLFYSKNITNARYNKPAPENSGYYDTFLFNPYNKVTYKVHFNEWWFGTIFRMDDYNFTRKDLVTIVANQDGGAHFDTKLDIKYRNLINGDTGVVLQPGEINHLIMGGSAEYNKKEVKFKDLHFALLRQVVHETILSLNSRYNLQLKYEPDFQSNFNRKLNKVSFNVSAIKD